MRTKALLLVAAVGAAGIASSMAQTVYSVNVVGFVNMDLPAGFALISNPLQATNNNLATILPVVPDFSTAAKWDPATQQFADSATYIGGWDLDPEIMPGEGFFVNLSEAATLTFVGEVRQGELSTTLVPGFNMVGSQVPQEGGLTSVLGFNPEDFDTAATWNTATQQYNDSATYIGGWDAEPVLAVGEGVVINRSSPGAWTRTFNVQ